MSEVEKNLCGREQEIIEAAQKVFAEHGYKKVTMDDVAAKLNISRSALYYYYKSKEDLFVAMGEYEFRHYELTLRQAIGEANTTDDRLIAFIRNFLPMRKRFRDVYQLGYDDFFYPPVTHNGLKSLVNSIHSSLIAEIFMKDKKISGSGNIEYCAKLLTYSIRGVLLSLYNAPIEQLERDVIVLCRIFCQGIPAVAPAVKNGNEKNDKLVNKD